MSSLPSACLPESEIQRLETCFPARLVAIEGGAQVSVRERGQGQVVVCLHGIGSGAASWLGVAQHLEKQCEGAARLIAWDAPGYGASTAVASSTPRAQAYGERLRMLLDALEIDRCVLVGHSLGALMAGAAVMRGSPLASRISRLVLISPARGYGAPERAEQAERVRAQRLESLASLGIAGMAAQRSSRLLSDNASELDRSWVRWNMARLNGAGYQQAVQLLCGDDLLNYLPPAMPVRVLCGEHDVVTSPQACAEVAAACGAALELVARAGHAGYVEQPEAIATALATELSAASQTANRKGT